MRSEKLAAMDDFLRAVLDAVPSMVFVVDAGLTVLDANRAAHRALGGHPEILLKRLCGEVLHCLNAGCGKAPGEEGACGTTEHCDTCVLRQSAREAHAGALVERRPYRKRLEREGKDEEIHLLVTAKAFDAGGEPLSFLVLEDVTEVVELRRLVPACAWCGKVRRDDAYWVTLQEWITRHSPLRFTHGMCPECAQASGQE